jgi:hypothetical protein
MGVYKRYNHILYKGDMCDTVTYCSFTSNVVGLVFPTRLAPFPVVIYVGE